MRISRDAPIFFHASVLVAGAHSPQGGSALLLEACQAGGFRAQTTFLVLLESLHALRRFPEQSLRCFDRLLLEINWELLSVPSGETLEWYHHYIDRKGVHVLTAAVEGAGLHIFILCRGDFIRQHCPQHEDYPRLPPPRTQPR
jgi:hypothetical protein